jgi:hypothetical protein
MPRPQDALFGFLGAAIVVLLMLHLKVAVFALVGAFICGALYVFAGMLPPNTERFGRRIFVSVFLAIVLSCIVLIVPGTLGLQGPHPDLQRRVIEIAVALPLLAVGFEILRTPRIIAGLLRLFGERQP